jgi:hypothetical protein
LKRRSCFTGWTHTYSDRRNPEQSRTLH